uniref:Pectinesterase inhibitor domain-containing protein n=1 Tax=Arundo donax TaxID=35708 RepID=A0A0A8YM48_ARUDO
MMMVAARTTTSVLAAVLLCTMAFFLLAADAGEVSSHHDLVAKACGGVMRHRWGLSTTTREYCESELRSHKQSTAAKNLRDLTLVTIDLMQSAAADADSKLSGLSVHSNHSARTARYCRLDYADLGGTVPVCRAIVEEYMDGDNQLSPADHFQCMERMANAASECWSRIVLDKELGKVMSKEVSQLTDRSFLYQAMLEEMLGVIDDNSI